MADEQAQVAETEVVATEVTSEDWKASLPEDIKDNTALHPIQDVPNLAKAYINASAMIGKDKVVIPGEHATDEDWSDFHAKTGRPDNPEGYQLELGETPDENLSEWFRNTAHGIGLNNSQAQKLVSEYNTKVTEQSEANQVDFEAIRGEVTKDLKKEYGSAYDDRLGLANGLAGKFGGGKDLTELPMADGTLLGDSPQFIRFTISVGEFIRNKVSEDEFEGLEKHSNVMTPVEAQEKLREIEIPNGPLWDRKHPQHAWSVEERNRLYEVIHAEEKM